MMNDSLLQQAEHSNELKVLLDNREKLIDNLYMLESDNLNKLYEKFQKHNILSKATALAFSSLDVEVDQKLKARFLFQQVCRGVEKKSDLCGKVLSVISNSEACVNERLRILGEEINNQLAKLNGHPEEDMCLVEDDILPLMKTLAGCIDKWDRIGLSLGLPNYIIETIGRKQASLDAKLRTVLSNWLTGRYKSKTLKQLKKVLDDPKYVQENYLAHNLIEEFRKFKDADYAPPVKRMKLQPKLNIEYQSTDITVNDGKSLILEVYISCESVSCLWFKDGQPLCDGTVYSDTHNDILLVYRASQETAGSYVCEVECHGEKVRSDSIVLTVSYSQEKKVLLDRYTNLAEIAKDSWLLPTTSKFINLALIKERRQLNKQDKHVAVGDFSTILQRKEKVTYDQVFGKYESGALILVEGRPGSGKTTLACKIARDWAKKGNVLRYVDHVFLLPLRGYKNSSTLKEMFATILDKAKKVNGQGFCFILDGLDEWQKEQEKDKTIEKLLSMESLSNAMVIVTSRPAKTIHYRDNASKRIEVLGFSTEHIYEYIEAYPFEETQKLNELVATKLKAYLQLHTNVLHMCYLPVHAAMVCYLYNRFRDDIPQTETKIYEYFTCAVILRKLQQVDRSAQLKSLSDLDVDCGENFKNICHLAFNMVCDSKQTMSNTNLPFDSQSPSFSLLTMDKITESYGEEGVITFLHLTHQEYLAAYHIAGLTSEEQTHTIDKYGGDENMLATWKFYCGISTNRKRNLSHFENLMKAMKANHLYKIQCAYESQESLFCNKIAELLSGTFSFNSHVLAPTDFTAINYLLKNTTYPLFSFSMQMCTSHELQSERKELEAVEITESAPNQVVNKVIKLCPSIVDKIFKLSLQHRKEFLEGAKEVYYELSTISLVNFDLNPSIICILLGYFSKDISIFASKYAEPLIQALKRSTKLSRLNVSTNTFGPKGAEILASIIECYSNLQELNISCNLIGSKGAKSLADGIKHCKNLEYLNLSGNNIGADGEKALSKVIRKIEIQRLDISWNNFSTVQLFAYQYKLKVLNLSATHIAAACRRGELVFASTLEEINLSLNSIDCEGAIMVAKALKPCCELTKLVLSCNFIGYKGAEAIVSIVPPKLQELDFSRNRIGEHYLKIAKKLEMYPQLKLNMSHNVCHSFNPVADIKRLVQYLADYKK